MSEGHLVLLANNGKEALELLAKESTPPGIILTDYSMPVMNGPEFLAELERQHPKVFAKTPIFIMTAGGDTHLLALEITGFVKKPFDLDELAKISELCRG